MAAKSSQICAFSSRILNICPCMSMTVTNMQTDIDTDTQTDTRRQHISLNSTEAVFFVASSWHPHEDGHTKRRRDRRRHSRNSRPVVVCLIMFTRMSLRSYREIGRVGRVRRGCYVDGTRKRVPYNFSYTALA